MNCRHCGTTLDLCCLDLGEAPPSNAYLTAGQVAADELRYPLRLLVCERCWLVQTEDHARREQLFTEEYAYFSSFSGSWLEHARRYVDAMVGRFGLDGRSHVVELAANDGYLLQYVRAAGIPCLGIEPTANTARAARIRGIEIVEDFFGVALATALAAAGRRADLVVANNVLAHVPDINDFVRGVALLLRQDGVATFEFPHLLRMVLGNQFDTAYHEHYSYLSLSAVEVIFHAAGLDIFDVEILDTHGGSLRVFAQRSDPVRRPRAQRVQDVLDAEERAGIRSAGFYLGFQVAALKCRDGLRAYLVDAQQSGLTVAAYGAAAKGNTLLNFAAVGPDLLQFVVDRNPAKQGRFMPGSRIPIFAEERLREARPDRVLILPWNLRREIVEQLHYVHDWGGRFVTAIPQLEVFGGVSP
jgi:SAM-dependent methyltransferase